MSLMFNGTTHFPALEGITFSGSFQALETSTVHGALWCSSESNWYDYMLMVA